MEIKDNKSLSSSESEVLVLNPTLAKIVGQEQFSEVSGLLCSDAKGFCIGAAGSLNSESSGVISSITKFASALDPSSDQEPIIIIDTDTSKVLIKREEEVSVAIQKENSLV